MECRKCGTICEEKEKESLLGWKETTGMKRKTRMNRGAPVDIPRKNMYNLYIVCCLQVLHKKLWKKEGDDLPAIWWIDRRI